LKSEEFVEVNTIRIFSWPSTLCKVFSYSNCTFPTSWTGVLGVLYVLMWWKAGWGSTFLAIVTSSLDLLDQCWYVYCILSHNSKVKMKSSIYSIRHLENITRQALSPVTRIFRTCPKCSLSDCGGVVQSK
jgi:hypothetical protein